MAYAIQYDLANDPTFLKRVTMAMLDYAHDVSSEDPGTANHVVRLAFATTVVNNPGTKAGAVSEAICAFAGTLSAGSTDQNIKDAVAALWDLFSGV
jgi:hypothetical protein